MAYAEFLRDFRRAYQHRGGVKALALGTLDPEWFGQLQTEMRWVTDTQASSDVGMAEHTTNWTRPVGVARQFSLYNPSGKPDEYLSDFAPPAKVGKKLVFPQLQATARFARLFGDELWNLRLNGLGNASKLSLHEEDPIEPLRGGRSYKARFHLPVFTSGRAEMLLDGESFHFEEGRLYFFHHGCVHAAINNDDAPRYHIVLDCLLTPELYGRIFPGQGGAVDAGFHRCSPAESHALVPGRPSPVDVFVTESGEEKRILDYGRSVPGMLTWYRKNYPSAFRPFDRLFGAR